MPQPTNMIFKGTPALTKWPSAKAVDLDDLNSNYGINFFRLPVFYKDLGEDPVTGNLIRIGVSVMETRPFPQG